MKKVTLYAMPTCPHCANAKEFFDEKEIEYEYKNVKDDPEARKEFVAKGHTGVPVIVIGDEEVLGFDQGKVEQLLGL